MVFQGTSVFPWMTVLRNAAYGLEMRGLDQPERERIATELLRQVGLGEFLNAYPAQLSEGMRQRVAIVRAFAMDPEVLLMDEPFGALDEQTRLVLQDELLRIWEETGKTVVFVTHGIDEAMILADRIIILSARPGTIRAEITVPFPRPRSIEKRPRQSRVQFTLPRNLGPAAGRRPDGDWGERVKRTAGMRNQGSGMRSGPLVDVLQTAEPLPGAGRTEPGSASTSTINYSLFPVPYSLPQ